MLRSFIGRAVNGAVLLRGGGRVGNTSLGGRRSSTFPPYISPSTPSSIFGRSISTTDKKNDAVAESHQPLIDTTLDAAIPPPVINIDSVNISSSLPSTPFQQKPSALPFTVNIPSSFQLAADRVPYWQAIPRWSNVTESEFLSYRWQVNNTVQGDSKLFGFLEEVLPSVIPEAKNGFDGPKPDFEGIKTKEDFINDVKAGIKIAPMSTRLTPHILSCIDWSNPLDDPLRRQFIPMAGGNMQDHPMLVFDSLHETEDSPVKGLVHRYNDKALFLATSVCPVYCRFCTRSYSVGGETTTVGKKARFLPVRKRWENMFAYIESTPTLVDIVVSGGDSYYLEPEAILEIGTRLLSIPHVRRFRFASKGLAVVPSRTLDSNDSWTDALITVSNMGRKVGKAVAMHTHFNHPNEITWVSRAASQKLFENGVVVRNQAVLLRGVNNNVGVMKGLIRGLADMNIQPYYIYQCDLVRGVEDLRTPLQEMLDIERDVRGTIAGFMTPQFVVDLPGGGGKRLAHSFESYDRSTGISTFVAPGVKDRKGDDGEEMKFRYYDPLWATKTGEL